jgi:rubrerythrin
MAAPTLTPTYDTGAKTKASAVVYVPPDRQVSDTQLAEQLSETGLNMAFVADICSAALAHERCGRHLYRSIAGRTNNPVLKAKYEQYGSETERHAAILERLITKMGGDPMYVSPAARAVEASDTKLVESTFLLAGSVDAMTQEMVMLDAVLLAESLDHANWTALTELAGELPEGALKEAFVEAVTEVGTEENDHLMWARGTRTELITLQAKSRMMAAAGAKAEELVATVRSWLGT